MVEYYKKNIPSLPKTMEVPKIVSYTMRTRRGKNGTKEKTNQDSFIACCNLNGNCQTHLFGVYDGHGVNGHHVSNYITSHLPAMFSKNLAVDEEGFAISSPEEALHSAYGEVFENLVNGNIDISFSGSTATTCYIDGLKIYTANSGDSRAIIGSQIGENNWVVRELSNDHKPDLDEEATRILEAGGRVEPYWIPNEDGTGGEFLGPYRVWLLDEDIPGLAMSRSIGDLVAASVGVAWEPGKNLKLLIF